MQPTSNKKRTTRIIYISIIVLLTAGIATLGYYSVSLQQYLQAQRADIKNLDRQIEALKQKQRNTSEEVTLNSDPTPEQAPAPVQDTDSAIIAAATQFAASHGIPVDTLSVTDKYSNFAEVSTGSAGMILKNQNNTWSVVSHGQQLNLDDARTHGIPIDTSSALYQSLTPAEREGLVTR